MNLATLGSIAIQVRARVAAPLDADLFRPMDPAQFRRWLLAVLAIAVVLRVAWALLVPVVPVSDSYAYDVFARNMVEHGTYGWEPDKPSAYWAVGTSAVYAALYALFDVDYAPIVVLNVLLGSGIVLLSMLLARRWFGDLPALSAGLLLACWPGQIQFTTLLASELLFTFLMLLALWVASRSTTGRGYLYYPLCGLLIAAAAYVRPIALLFPFMYAFFLWLHGQSIAKTVLFVCVTLVVAAAAIAPWSMRNTDVFGTFVTISTNSGANTWMGNNPDTTGFYMPLPEEVRGMNEAERDRILRDRAMTYIRDEPLSFVRRTLVKAVRLYERETIGVAWNEEGLRRTMGEAGILANKVIAQGYWMAALALAVFGFGAAARRAGAYIVFHPAFVMIAYVTAVHAIIVIQDRYHYPAVPFLAMFGGVALSRLVLYWYSRSRAGRPSIER